MRVPRRLALTLVALGAVGAVVAGATFAAFQSQAVSQAPAFAVGTVRLDTIGGSADCTLANLKPGEGSTGLGGTQPPCTYTVIYRGTLAGWVGLNVTVQPQTGGLYTAGSSTGLQLEVTDAYGNTYAVGGIDQLVKVPAAAVDTNSDGSVKAGWQDTFTINYFLPADASGTRAGTHSTVTLLAHAVQESNDPLLAHSDCPALGWDGSGTGAAGACASVTGGGGGSSTTPGAACQSGAIGGVWYGCTQGYWQSPPGQAVISANGVDLNAPVTLGAAPRTVTLRTLVESNEVLPPSYGICASTLLDCGSNLSAGVTAQQLGKMASQTLALAYSMEYVPGFGPETLTTLGCATYGGDAATLGMSGSTSVAQVLAVANALIGGSTATGPTTAAQVDAMKGLLGGCVLRTP